MAAAALPGSVDAGETGWGVCEALVGLGQPGIGLHAAPGRAGCAFAPTRKFHLSGHVDNGRVGDYVSISDSEFRRWARGGSNGF